MSIKKSKSDSSSSVTPLSAELLPVSNNPINAAWTSMFALADDGRAEFHKQAGQLVSFVGGVATGVTGLVKNVNDRSDQVVRSVLAASDQAGRSLAGNATSTYANTFAKAPALVKRAIGASRDQVRNVAQRATSTARVAIAPVKRAS